MSADSVGSGRKLAGVTAIIGLASVLALAGCESQNQAISAKTSDVCPTCKAETLVQPITGWTYTRDLCPSCRSVAALDETTRASIERAVGAPVGETVHVCDRCGSTSGTCPICRQRHM